MYMHMSCFAVWCVREHSCGLVVKDANTNTRALSASASIPQHAFKFDCGRAGWSFVRPLAIISRVKQYACLMVTYVISCRMPLKCCGPAVRLRFLLLSWQRHDSSLHRVM
jgi:hypothetical protein